MNCIRYVLFLLIFVASVFLGKLLSKKYVERVKELKELKNCLNIFKSKIKFTYEPIGEIFEEISRSAKNNIGEIFKEAKENMRLELAGKSWEIAVDNSENNLSKEDKATIKMLSKLLRTN